MNLQDKIGAACFVVFFMFIAAVCGSAIDRNYFEKQAIAHHAAHYDSQTGMWQWNDEVRP